MLVYVLSFIDRQILSLLVKPMRAALHISDFEMSLLMGSSFALFYTFFGIPLGRVADLKSRRSLIAAGVTVWSLMTACCGVARNYAQLLFLRMGVGVGEAALSPSAYSLISDYFPKERLATAISVYGMGIYIGSGLAYLAGGLVIGMASAQTHYVLPIIGQLEPWQTVFFVIGIPGLMFALLVYTVREPRRGAMGGKDAGGKSNGAPSIREVAGYVWNNRGTFISHNLGFSLFALASYGCAGWIPAFFGRCHGWPPAQVGLWYGTIMMVFGSAGILCGGRLADALTRKGYEDAKMRTGFIAALAAIPLSMAYPLVSDGTVAMALLAPFVFALAMPFGVAPAAIQEMMPHSMRGQASAVYLFLVNLIGMGLGPSAVALFTDYVFHDDNAVGYSLLIVSVLSCAASALLLYKGMLPFARSMRYLRAWQRDNA
ncbi:MAG: MFS transporter [Candidatus Hydrogenedentes bacterium]|nr:MFS transporter [Candidatus Hydrogenedentota bacterium]